MGIDRREFLKLAGITTIAGLGGLTASTALRKSLSAASQVSPDPRALVGKRWAMVINMSKFKTDEDYTKVIDACHNIHNVPNIGEPKHEIKWIWKETYEHAFPGQEHEYIEERVKHKPFILLCNHCDNPPCVRVCPTKATFKRADGLVMQDMHRCIGCRFCMAGCPFGVRSFNFYDPRQYMMKENREYPTRTKGVVEKCTFCFERLAVGLKPACAEASNGAMVFGDLRDPKSEVRELLRTNYTIRRKPELGTQPNVFYIVGGKNA
jgi:Fe-S-cluster-containing dehydrogenase component